MSGNEFIHILAEQWLDLSHESKNALSEMIAN